MSTFYKEFSVNPTSRELTDTSPAVTVVQHDANVDGILFHIPASFSAVDLTDSGTKLQVFYMLPGGSTVYLRPLTAYTAQDGMDTSYKYFAWDFTAAELLQPGIIRFSLCVQNATTNQDWNTRVAQLRIADTLDHTDSTISPGTKITSSIETAIESATKKYIDSKIATYDTKISAELDKLNHAFDNLSLQYGGDGLVYVFSNGEPVGEGVELKYQGYVDVTGINLDQTDVKITETDGTVQLNATVLPDNASNKHVRWKTSAEDIATVSKKGLVKAVKNGNAVITAETVIGGYTSTCNVLVKMPIAVESIALSADAKDAHVGDTTAAPTVTILPADASNKAVKWSSSNTTVATVDADTGAVKGLYEGTSVITATTVSGGKTASYTLTVSAAVTYPKTGLVVDFDAINNAGAGKAHDNNASTWVDLSGNGHDLDITWENGATGGYTVNALQHGTITSLANHTLVMGKGGILWHDDSLELGVNCSQILKIGKTNVAGITLVAVYKEAWGFLDANQIISAGSKNGDTSVDGPYIGRQRSRSTSNTFVITNNDIVWHSIVILTEDNNGNWALWVNGKKYSSGTSKAKSYDIPYVYFGNSVYVHAHHFSVYERMLTDQEIADATWYFNNVYHVSDIKSTTTIVAPSGTILPYTSAVGVSYTEPSDKTDVSTFAYNTDNSDIAEASNVSS